MKLIVGLGNKGKEYNNTRHNIGFMVIDKYVSEKKLPEFKEKFGGLYIDTIINNEKVIFLKPQKYINLSGEVIRMYLDFYKIDINDLLIINDDLDLEIGTFKIKTQGGSAGHNGLKNIEMHLKTKEYKRIKIGISNNKLIETKDYVLGKISSDDLTKINEVLKTMINIIDDYVELTFDKLMNKYNTKWYFVSFL